MYNTELGLVSMIWLFFATKLYLPRRRSLTIFQHFEKK